MREKKLPSSIIKLKRLTELEFSQKSATLEREGEQHKSSLQLRTWQVWPFFILGVFIILFMAALIQKLTASRRRRRRKSEQMSKEFSHHRSPTRSSPMHGEVRRSELVYFVEEGERFELDELLGGVAELRTQGFCSSLYVVTLRSGAVYAVKRLRKVEASFEEFGVTMGKIGDLRHPNLLPLVCFNNTLDEKLLTYKFQPNGSLLNLFESHAQGKRAFPWKLRLSIAIGIARGLHFIHNHQEEAIPHGIIKLSNVMLNEDDEPLISKYGYAKLVPASTDNPAMKAYAAPEKDLSEKSDVYSFGVILLELLTGKSAERSGYPDLPRWVRSAEEVLDEEIWEEEMYAFPLLNLSLKCVEQKPHERPTFAEVLEKIEEIVNIQQEDSSNISIKGFA